METIADRLSKEMSASDFAKDAFLTKVVYLITYIKGDVREAQEAHDQVQDGIPEGNKQTRLGAVYHGFSRAERRIHNIKLVLQELLYCLKSLPFQGDLSHEAITRFVLFHNLVSFQANLLKDKDTQSFILREFQKRDGTDAAAIPWQERQIAQQYDDLSVLVDEASAPSWNSYMKLFEALQRLCVFWFAVKNENPLLVRKSDIYTYMLTSLLLKKRESLTQQP